MRRLMLSTLMMVAIAGLAVTQPAGAQTPAAESNPRGGAIGRGTGSSIGQGTGSSIGRATGTGGAIGVNARSGIGQSATSTIAQNPTSGIAQNPSSTITGSSGVVSGVIGSGGLETTSTSRVQSRVGRRSSSSNTGSNVSR